jgi:type II secretory pathway predicted ATPase ExeA
MKKITITISGVAGSGKTMIQQWLAEQLSQKFKQVNIDWGIDDNPVRDSEILERFMNDSSDNTEITIKTQNLLHELDEFGFRIKK